MARSSPSRSQSPRGVPAPPPPRSFPQARARATYERILAAAFALYAEQGFHETQTPDIAERAGVSVGGLYRYFEDKHQIFAEIMHRALEANRLEQDRLIEALELRLDEGSIGPAEVARGFVEWTWQAVRDVPPDLLRNFQAMALIDPTFRELSDQYDRYERQVAARLLKRFTSRGHIPSPLAAARVLDLVIPTVAIWAVTHPEDSRGVKDALLQMVRCYLEDERSVWNT